VLYPELNITKVDLARYYQSIAEWALPYLVNRPLSLVRCPQGREAKCFYQRHAGAGTPDAIASMEIADDHETENYVYIRDLEGLISLVQMGVLEIHPWGSRVDNVERPDQIVLDFDPGEGVRWKQIVTGAIRMRDLLAELGLRSFVRTTGGNGLHVVVPLVRRSSWDDAKQFARDLADRFERQWPKEYIATASKSQRGGKIYIDYLRNARTATAIGNYSTRAREGAAVATQLDWKELGEGITPADFNVLTVPQRMAKLGVDPWAEFASTKQSLTKAMRQKIAVR
jgi:bifunctional non-homologous end joining protein LigD